jgi:hypothetical protein
MSAIELVEPNRNPPQHSAVVMTPAMLLQMAVTQGADLERLERLMAMKKEYEADEARKAFRRDFAVFRGENVIIPKSKYVDRGKAGSFMQAEYDDVCRRLSPALSKHGFSFRHDQKFTAKPWTTDGKVNDMPWVVVTCFLEHRDGHTETLELEGPPGDLSANTPVQNMQATGSYLKRQSLLAITGTATGGEDDESKLRGRGARGARDQEVGEQTAEPASEDDPLVIDGTREARGGTTPLLVWWGKLTEVDRKRLTPRFMDMRKAARLVDNGGAQ